jgi:hypothetical protein
VNFSRSTQSSTAPPTISMVQTIQTLNSTPLMMLWNAAPSAAAGRKAISTPMMKRRGPSCESAPIAIAHSRWK